MESGQLSTASITGNDPGAAVAEFFERLGRYCASRDYEAAEALFASDVASFGTKVAVAIGVTPLRREQWEGIWPYIDEFRVELNQLRAGGDERYAWGMVPWTSAGFDEQGKRFDRPGRATVVMEHREGTWLAVHTHFSLVPGTPNRTHGAQPD